MNDIVSNLNEIRSRIEQACDRSKRRPDEVSLLAVTKYQSHDRIREAGEVGIRLFGENRVQEAEPKIEACPREYRWHMIGHLQTNKARDAVRLFEMIESVDSLHLAEALSKWAEREGRTLPILAQVNVAQEASKYGYAPSRLKEELAALNALRAVELHGLMTMAPYATNPERVRPVFRRLRELKTELEDLLGAPLPILSMGMSGDFEVAIEEGATLIRLGTVLFGGRSRA